MAERDRLAEEVGHEMRLSADSALMRDDIAAELKGETSIWLHKSSLYRAGINPAFTVVILAKKCSRIYTTKH
jgi:hypothetical protein